MVVKLALHHDSRTALAAVVRELGSFGLVVPGLTAGGRGLPKPTPVVRLRSYLVPRDRFQPEIYLDAQPVRYEEPIPAPGVASAWDMRCPRPLFRFSGKHWSNVPFGRSPSPGPWDGYSPCWTPASLIDSTN